MLVYAGLRVPAGERESRPFGEVLAPLLDTFRASAGEAGAELIEDIAPDAARARVRVRPGSVDRILTNLVENACRYAVSESTPVVRISARREGGRCASASRTTGPGSTRGSER